jgi:glycosyltransferase involved in cell wall biosynthesis
MSKFSVLIPVYGGDSPQKFSEALSSIFSNTLQPDEILLVCDGPLTSELENIIDLKINKKNLKLLRIKENKGIVNALNLGLKEVKNDVVIRCDSDDINDKDRFKILIEKIKEGYDVVGSQTTEIDQDGKVVARKLLPLNHDEILRYARIRNPINHMTVAYRASHVLDVGGYPDIYLKEDYALWAKLIHSGRKLVNLQSSLVDANAGISMYSRRGGFKAALSEFKLQLILVKCNISPLSYAFIIGLCRAIILISPNGLRAYIYKNLLRK